MPLDLSQIRACALDLDGVVWRDAETLPGTPQFFHFLNERGIPYVFVTNNSTRTLEDFAHEIETRGVPVTTSQIINSSLVTAELLKRHFPPGTAIYVVGHARLGEMMRQHGFVVSEISPKAVVVGLDRELTYHKLTVAGQFIMAGAEFIGTNADRTFPMGDGAVTPGAGTIVGALEIFTGKKALVMGKPEAPMFHAALDYLKTRAQETLMIGDRLETDILGAQQVGMKTALVLTGIHQPSDVGEIVPDGMYDSLATLLEAWRRL
ncbi:MAG: HAD-IIA family hydrolase [Anaerolineae bacterium]